MKKSMCSLALLPALVCALTVTTASAQDNTPLPENAQMGAADDLGMYQPMNPDLFYNYYPNTFAGATSAAMYPAPLPVPQRMGHTYFTYQPLYPHEFMYAHQRTYYTPYAGADAFYQGGPCANGIRGGGYNKTTVTWHSGAFGHLNIPFHVRGMGNLRNRFHSNHGCNGCR